MKCQVFLFVFFLFFVVFFFRKINNKTKQKMSSATILHCLFSGKKKEMLQNDVC